MDQEPQDPEPGRSDVNDASATPETKRPAEAEPAAGADSAAEAVPGVDPHPVAGPVAEAAPADPIADPAAPVTDSVAAPVPVAEAAPGADPVAEAAPGDDAAEAASAADPGAGAAPPADPSAEASPYADPAAPAAAPPESAPVPAAAAASESSTEPARGPAAPPTKAEARAREKASALRAQLARERAQGWRARLRDQRLGVFLAVTVALVLGGYLLRVPFYRAAARQGGPLADWAVGKLVEERDPASFELYLHQMGTYEGREACGELVYLLAGRRRLPRALREDEEPRGKLEIPEDPAAVAEHSEALADALTAEDYPALQLGALYALNYLSSRDWGGWARSEELLVLASRQLAHPDSEHRRLAALVLTTRAAPAAAQPALIRAANPMEPDPRVRAFAVEALALLEDPSLQAVLARALEDPEPQVRGAAKRALERLGDALTVEQLAQLAQGDAQRDAVATLVAAKPGPAATALLLELSQAGDSATRREALQGLAEREGDGPREALQRALSDPDPQVRVLAAIRLRGREDGERALPDLARRMASWSPDDPGTGWNELLELHRSLRTLSGERDVRSPTPEPESWPLTQRGWAQVFEGR